MNFATRTVTLRRWGNPNDAAFAETVFVHDGDSLPRDLSRASVVLRQGGLARARDLLERGAGQVLIGEAALLDGSVIGTLSAEFGRKRIGLWVPARRMATNWALDHHSNADFRCVTPSNGAPAWEVLKCDDSGSGTDVFWWIDQMTACGACAALVAVDMQDDDDLNICAGLVERFGPALWLTPLTNAAIELEDWVRYGQARNLAIRQVRHDDPIAMRALRQHLEGAIGDVA
jgi:hypothetical protein